MWKREFWFRKMEERGVEVYIVGGKNENGVSSPLQQINVEKFSHAGLTCVIDTRFYHVVKKAGRLLRACEASERRHVITGEIM